MFIMIISEDPRHSHAPFDDRVFGSGAVTRYLFLRLNQVCRGWNSNTQHSACGATALTHLYVLVFLSFKNSFDENYTI